MRPPGRASETPPVEDVTPEAIDDEDNDYEEPEPPTAERVARRTLALTAVAARATLEMDAPEMDDADFHAR